LSKTTRNESSSFQQVLGCATQMSDHGFIAGDLPHQSSPGALAGAKKR
jgi:hypothetical protein